MNHIYRLVWNAARQAWAAVAETAVGRGSGSTRSGRARRALGTAILALPAAGAGLSALAQTVQLAPGQQGRAYVSPNGTTVVDIATANAAGVSHNKFNRYDVGAKGLVLNNTTAGAATPSQLAGSVLGNMSSSRTAGVIVNEVVSANRSVLAGFTEVAGRRADVVVANPWGITCTGCGFINTDRVTLTTGAPRWGSDGALAGFTVKQGDILVNGGGLNASAQQVLDLVTRSVRLEGAVHAQDLGVFAGSGEWAYGDRSAGAPDATAGAAAPYAVDASALGAMYANQIRLVANEAGVGVRLLGDAAAQVGDVRITAAGQVELRNHVSARGSVLVASTADVDLAGALLGAGQAVNLSGGQVAITGGAYVQAATSLDVAATAGVQVQDSGLKADGGIRVAAARAIDIAAGSGQGIQSTAGAVALEAGGALALAGAVSAEAGGVRLRSGADLANTGSVLARQALDVEAAGALTNQGTLQGGTVAVRARSVTNDGTVQATAGGARVESAADLTNRGLVQAQSDLALAAAGALANPGRLLAGNSITLAAGSVDNAGLASAQGGTLRVAAATVANTGTAQGAVLAVEADTLANAGRLLSTQGSATLSVTGQAANSGTLQSAGTLSVTAQGLENDGDVLAANGAASLAVDTLANRGSITANGALTLQAGSASNAGTLGATGNLGASILGDFSNGGTVQALNDLNLQVGGALDNRGLVVAGGEGTVGARRLDNAVGAEVRAARRLAVATGADGVANSGLLKGGLGSGSQTSLAVTTQGAVTNEASGRIEADGLQLTAGALTNRGTVTARAGGSTVKVGGRLDNAAGATMSFGAAASTSEVVAGQVANLGTLQSAGHLRFTLGGRFDNGSSTATGARLLAGGDLAFRGKASTPYAVVNYGSIDAQGALAFGGHAPAQAGDPIVVPPVTVCTSDYCGSGRLGSFTTHGTVQAGRVDLATELLALGAEGVLMSRGDMDILADRLQMAEAPDPLFPGQTVTSRILGGMAGVGTPQVKVASLASLDVPGLIYSRGDLEVTAPDIRIGANGAIAALNDLHLAATRGALDLATPVDPDATFTEIGTSTLPGNITNLGTLYAGNTLSARVNGTFTNAIRIETVGGTRTATAKGAVAAGQNIDIVANTFVNNSDVNSAGDLRIVAASLRNEVQGGDRRVYSYQGFDDTWTTNAAAHGNNPDEPVGWAPGPIWDDGGTSGGDLGDTYVDEAQNLFRHYTETLKFRAGEEPVYWPTLTAAHNAKLYFNNGKNLGGLVQGVDSVLMQGFAARSAGAELIAGLRDDAGRMLVAPQAADADMAVFTNDSLAQVTVDKTYRRTRTIKNTSADDTWRWCTFGSDAVCTQGANGSMVPIHIVDAVHTILPDGYSGARIYTASLNGGNFTLFNEGSSTRATYERGDPSLGPAVTPTGAPGSTITGGGRSLGVVQSTELLTVGARPTPVPGPAQSSVLPGDGTQTGWTPVSLDILPTMADGTGLQVGLSFGGVQVRLPANANGLFVLARDPAAGYLVESNPLYRNGAAATGSEYLRDRLGYSPGELQIRLGDGSYEAWLVQQQLIAQTGNMLLAGYSSLDQMMRGLMDNAAGQAAALGLVWGQALTAEQVAALTSDLVWMVKTTINGKDVLVPVVYLSQATKDEIRKGAIIQAGSGTLVVNGQANSGTISGVSVTNAGGGQGPASLFDFGSGGASAQNFNDQSFEIVKSYLLSAGGGAVGIADVTGWLEKNKSKPEELGKVLPYAYQRYMALGTGGGLLSANDKAFVDYIGNYAKQQRLEALDKTMADWEAYKKDNDVAGRSGTLNSLFKVPPAPPQWMIDQAVQGVILNDAEKALVGTLLVNSGVDPTKIGAGAITAAAIVGGGVAGLVVGGVQVGASAALVGGQFVTTGIAPFTAVSTGTLAAGPIGIVAATLAIAGQALANLIRAETFEKDLKEQREKIAKANGSDVAFWLEQKGGAEQLFLSMAKIMAN